jgi:hypothetical protein
MSDTGDNVRDTMDGCSSQQQVNRFEPFRSNDCATKMTFVARIDEASHVLEWKVEVSEATKALMAPHYILLAAWKHVCVCVCACVCVLSLRRAGFGKCVGRLDIQIQYIQVSYKVCICTPVLVHSSSRLVSSISSLGQSGLQFFPGLDA